ncbi:uncharacterized protein AB9W97_014954 isoform 1-T1 [Spinachia spinachia]
MESTELIHATWRAGSTRSAAREPVMTRVSPRTAQSTSVTLGSRRPSHRAEEEIKEAVTAVELMADKPGRFNVVSTRLLFIPSLPVPTPPPWPGLSWQALISLPDRLQT